MLCFHKWLLSTDFLLLFSVLSFFSTYGIKRRSGWCASHLPPGPAGFFMMEAVGYGDLHSWRSACLNNMGVVYTYLASRMHFALLLPISYRLFSLGTPKVLHEPHRSRTRCTVNLAWQTRFYDTQLHYSLINLIVSMNWPCCKELKMMNLIIHSLTWVPDGEGIIAYQHISHSSNINALK